MGYLNPTYSSGFTTSHLCPGEQPGSPSGKALEEVLGTSLGVASKRQGDGLGWRFFTNPSQKKYASVKLG